MLREKCDPREAMERAQDLRADPKVRAWLRRARRLFKDLPDGVWVYWQEDQLHLMALGPAGEKYINHRGFNAGSDPEASVDRVVVPGSDAGAW